MVAPSSPAFPDQLDAGIALLEMWGFEPVEATHLRDEDGHLAGDDLARAADMTAAFRDPTVRAVWAARGGYGAGRMADLVDWQALREDPKLLIGFSDITALHAAAWQRTQIVTLHGQFVGQLEKVAEHDDAASHLIELLTGGDVASIPVPRHHPLTTIEGGVTEGRLLGGNLALVASLIGTVDELDLRDSILLLEEVGERPYRIDRMLIQLLRSGALDEVRGVVVGELRDCEPPPNRPSLSALEVLDEVLGALGVPVLYGLPLGHTPSQRAVPLGVRVRLDADAGTLALLEAPFS